MSQHLPFSEESVKSGLVWTDHSAHRLRLLVSNSWAPYVYAAVVFFITISAKNVAVIVGRLLRLLGEASHRAISDRQNDVTGEPTLRTPLLNAGEGTQSRPAECINYNTTAAGQVPNGREAAGTSSDNRINERSSTTDGILPPGGRDLIDYTWNYILNRDNPHKAWTFLCCLFLFAFQFGIFGLGYAANGFLESGKAALWHSDKCGIWEFPTGDATDEEATRSDVILRQKEARAGEYAKYCYEPSNQLLPVYCNFFAHRNITFEETRPYKCPFPEKSICAGSQVVRFDTGKVPATHLGINQANPYRFQRIATCAPLSVNKPYVRQSEDNGTPVFRYYYGREVDSNNVEDYLFDTRGNPFNWTVPTYDASAFMTGPASDSFWKPIDDLDPGPGRTLTLIFIRPLQIYYLGPSGDPVFPTDRVLQFPEGDRWHVKSDPKARVLSCVEETNLCDPSGEACWPASHHNNPIHDRGYWLMKLALKNSNIYNSFALRLGTALVAQEMVSQQLSLPLEDNHWMTEARRLFSTSLASAQFKTWSIGSGEDYVNVKDYGWVDQTPDEAKEAGGLCNLLKFKSTGYTDIDLLSMILLLVLPWPLTALFSTRLATLRSYCQCWCEQGSQRSAMDAEVAAHASSGHAENNGTASATSTANAAASITENGGANHRQRATSGTGESRIHADRTGPGFRSESATITAEGCATDDRLVVEILGLPIWCALKLAAKLTNVILGGLVFFGKVIWRFLITWSCSRKED